MGEIEIEKRIKKIKRSHWLLISLYSPGVGNDVNEPIEGSIRIMKMLFLLDQEMRGELSNFYEFAPYLYGPCSFDVYRDLDGLKGGRMIFEVVQKRWSIYKLTARGIRKAEPIYNQLPNSVKEKLRKIKKIVNGLSFLSLLKYVYKDHPEFGGQSFIAVS